MVKNCLATTHPLLYNPNALQFPHRKGTFEGDTWAFPDLYSVYALNVICMGAAVMQPRATSTLATSYFYY